MSKESSPEYYLWSANFVRSDRTGKCYASVQHSKPHPTISDTLEEARQLNFTNIQRDIWIAEKGIPACVGRENTNIKVPSLDIKVSALDRLKFDFNKIKNRMMSRPNKETLEFRRWRQKHKI